MGAHCAIHALGAGMITGSPLVAGMEFATHFFIDYNKCHDRISYNLDQALHIGLKVTYAVYVSQLYIE